MAVLLVGAPLASAATVSASVGVGANGGFSAAARPDCPSNVRATPNSNGSITLTWDAVSGATEYRVYRSGATGPFVQIATTTSTTYTDTTTAAGQTYRYRVTAYNGQESTGCGFVTTAAVPFFGSLAAGALAAAGSVGSVIWFRRR